MIRTFCMITFCLFIGWVSTAAAQQSLLGSWEAEAESDEGVRSVQWTVTKKDDKFSGTLFSVDHDTDHELRNIKVSDSKMSFEFDMEVGGEQMLIKVATEMVDGKLEGTWHAMSGAGDELASGGVAASRAVETLFDGKSLDNFRGFAKEEISKGWSVKDGSLHFDGSKGAGDIITKKQYANFELTFEWKMTKGGNSGVMYRVSMDENRPYFTGPEYQLLDDDVHRDGKNVLTSAGSIYALYAPENKKLKPVGEWNQTKIVLDGNHVEHWLNGAKVVEAEIGGKDWNEKVAASKFKSWTKFGKNSKGHICFQDHGDPFELRNIQIKNLD